MSKASTLSRITVGAAATASSVSGAVVVFDFPDVSHDNLYNNGSVSFGSINLNGTFASTLTGSPGFVAGMGYYGGLNFYSVGVSAAMDTATGYLRVFSAGSSVSSAASFLGYGGSANRYGSDLPRSIFYLGLKLTQGGQDHYGWLELSSVDAPPGGFTTVTFHRFAFEDVAGQSITTPAAVPEASTLGFAGGLFGLVVAAHLRRRKAKQAAAPDSLLKLAAGESIRG